MPQRDRGINVRTSIALTWDDYQIAIRLADKFDTSLSGVVRKLLRDAQKELDKREQRVSNSI